MSNRYKFQNTYTKFAKHCISINSKILTRILRKHCSQHVMVALLLLFLLFVMLLCANSNYRNKSNSILHKIPRSNLIMSLTSLRCFHALYNRCKFLSPCHDKKYHGRKCRQMLYILYIQYNKVQQYSKVKTILKNYIFLLKHGVSPCGGPTIYVQGIRIGSDKYT